jgi:hypothetical protein
VTLEPNPPTAGPTTPVPPTKAPVTGTDPNADEQSELDLGVISTGAPDIDRALSPLEGLKERPVSEHPEVYEQVLGELSATMADNPVDVAESADAADPVSEDAGGAPFGGG